MAQPRCNRKQHLTSAIETRKRFSLATLPHIGQRCSLHRPRDDHKGLFAGDSAHSGSSPAPLSGAASSATPRPTSSKPSPTASRVDLQATGGARHAIDHPSALKSGLISPAGMLRSVAVAVMVAVVAY
eukprot:scaffold647979_cov42-Prasinocladus_malaysianus.AAC.1